MLHVQPRFVGPITAYGGQTYVTNQTGTGSTFAMSASPVFTGTVTMPALTTSKSDTNAWSSTVFWNNTFSGATLLNSSSTLNAVTGIGFYGGANGNAVAGIAMVQSTANSIGDLVLAAGGSGVSSTVPERMRIAGATGAITVGGALTVNSLAVTATTTFSGIATASAANAQMCVNRSATGSGKYALFGWYTAGTLKWQAGIDGDASDSRWTLYSGAASIYALNVESDGRVWGSSLHNNAGSLTGTTNQYIASGTFTATCTNTVNAATSSCKIKWARIGNCVVCKFDLTTTPPAGGAVQVDVTIPIASTLASSSDLGGSGAINATPPATVVGVQGIVAGGKAAIQFNATGLGGISFNAYGTFMYEVL